MVSSIINMLEAVAGIVAHEIGSRWLKKAYKLQKEYDEVLDNSPVDHNKLDRIERDLLRLHNLVATEIKGQAPSNM